MGWDGMGWDGMGWDGMGWDGMGWDGMGWDTKKQKATMAGKVQGAKLTLREQVRLRQRWSLVRHILRRQNARGEMGCTGHRGNVMLHAWP